MKFKFNSAKAQGWLDRIERSESLEDVSSIDDLLSLAGVCMHLAAKEKNWIPTTITKQKEQREATESGNQEKISTAILFNSYLSSRIDLGDYSFEQVQDCEVYFNGENDRWQVDISDHSAST